MSRDRRPRYGMFVVELVPGIERHGFVWEVFTHRDQRVVLRDIAPTEDIAVVAAREQMERLEQTA